MLFCGEKTHKMLGFGSYSKFYLSNFIFCELKISIEYDNKCYVN